MSFVPPKLPDSPWSLCFYDEGGIQTAGWAVGYTEKQLQEYAKAYLKAYLEDREPVAWAYRAFPQSEFITLTMDKDDLENAIDGSIPLYE